MREAVHELIDEMRGLKHEVKASSSKLADAFGDERFDEERMGELFVHHDELLGRARLAVVGALGKIHDVLEPGQRKQLSRWIGRRADFGPYRM